MYLNQTPAIQHFNSKLPSNGLRRYAKDRVDYIVIYIHIHYSSQDMIDIGRRNKKEQMQSQTS